MKFSELPYKRPDIEAIHQEYKTLQIEFINAQTADEQNALIRKWNEMRIALDTMGSLANVHYTQNVKDEFAVAEKEFFDKSGPTVAEWSTDFAKLIVSSKFRAELEAEWGALFIRMLQNSIETFKPEIKEFLVEESKLEQEYTDLLSSAEIEFDGEKYNLTGLDKFGSSPDRSMRKKSMEARLSFFQENEAQLDRIYDDLVKLRHKKALALGFSNYIGLRYKEMGRVDYTPAEVAVFRQSVVENIVPIAVEARKQQAKRLGVDTLYAYDEKVQFTEGNPTPQGSPEWIVNQAKEMYRELSPETGKFFDMMIERELMDLVNRPSKAGGGYCTSFPKFGVPFIFSNFNNTTHDVEVLTHEAGHAFQAYSSRHHKAPEYFWPTYEACEIHSMSMEFLTWPWMKNFFGSQTNNFFFYHLQGALLFFPYGCAVDEFQHWVYENYEATSAERKAQWKVIEKKYMPWKNYDGVYFGEIGGVWQAQAHIYKTPFYYIDYALAQTCSLQFWSKSQKNSQDAFKDYLRICEIGGSQTFLEIVKSGNLVSPFDPNCLKNVAADAMKWLQNWEPTPQSDEMLAKTVV